MHFGQLEDKGERGAKPLLKLVINLKESTRKIKGGVEKVDKQGKVFIKP